VRVYDNIYYAYSLEVPCEQYAALSPWTLRSFISRKKHKDEIKAIVFWDISPIK